MIDAIIRKDEQMVKFIIKKNAFKGLNYNDSDGNTPLHIAASFGDLNIVWILIDKGSNLDWRNNDGNTPLHIA